ncbi:MAG: PASTA domain-containing protein [Desulfurivibrio sp.]|nr:PASTA domain-containing protein [Desulfurivibrio sp.]
MPSPLAGVARQLSGWSREWQQDEAAPPARKLARQQQELYRQWLESRDDTALAGGGAVARFPRRLPDVVGQSLRRALRDLQAAGLTVQVEGSGRVVGQTPAAGTPLAGIKAATIKLRAAYTTADVKQ